MSTTLNFVPESITVTAVAGATLAFSIAVTHADGTPYDLEGYEISAPILQPDGVTPPVDALDVTETDEGVLTLKLTAEQSQALGSAHPPVAAWSSCVWLESAEGKHNIAHVSLVFVPA